MAVDIGFIPSSNINSCHQVKKKNPSILVTKILYLAKFFCHKILPRGDSGNRNLR